MSTVTVNRTDKGWVVKTYLTDSTHGTVRMIAPHTTLRDVRAVAMVAVFFGRELECKIEVLVDDPLMEDFIVKAEAKWN